MSTFATKATCLAAMFSLSAAALTALGDSGAASKIYVQISPAVKLEALGVVRHYGKVEATDSKAGKYTLTVKRGVNVHSTLIALRHDRRISLAWSDREPVTRAANMQTITGLTTAFNAIRPTRAEALEELAESKRGKREKPDEKGADFLGGYLYFASRRAYPYDRMDWSAYGRAIDHAATMPTLTTGGSSNPLRPMAVTPSAKPWQFLGPKNLTFPYQWGFGVGPGTGRVNAAAYDPSTAGTFYVGGAEGGLWKTTDNGTTWTPLGDAWQYICVSSIAVDPKHPKTIYVGTGDFPGWNSFSEGMMKSVDGGATWTNSGQAQFGGSCVSAIIVDPDTTSTITVTTGDGGYQVEAPGKVWRSTDGGISWSAVISTVGEWSDASVSILDSGARHYYAAGYNGSTTYLERSDNQGLTWTVLTPPSGLTTGAYQIKASAVNGKTVYFFAPNTEKIYKSTDMGSTWTDISGNLGTLGDWGQAYYDYYLTVVNNAGSDDLFAGLIDVFESTDGGTTWVSVVHAYSGSDLAHVDQHSLTVNPNNPNDILIGNDGGVYRGKRTNGTWGFTSLNKAMGITQFYDGAWDPIEPTRMLGGAQDNGTPLASGDLSNWGDVIGGDGFFVAINPKNTKNQYGTVYYDSVVGTEDGWQSSFGMSPPIGAGEPAPFVTIIQQDPVNTQYLYCTTDFLYRWDNSSQTWLSHLGGRQLSGGAVIHCVSVAPSNGKVIYTGSDDGEIFVSRDGGTTFTSINSNSLPNRAISAISVDRKNPNQILVGLSGTGTAHLFQCTNTATSTPTYTSVSGAGSTGLPDISLNCVDRDITAGTTAWYVGTDIGVFVTTNAGKSWLNATVPLGLPSCQVTAIQTTLYNTINVATYGRGMWKLPLSALGAVGQAPNTVESMDGQFVPSPPIPLNGFIKQLAADDNNIITMASGFDKGLQSQAAAIEADYNNVGSVPLDNATFSITSSTTVPTTLQVFVLNVQTGQYDLMKTFPSTAAMSNTIIPLAVPNPAMYMNASGTVKAVLRALIPSRNASAFQLKIDSFTLSAATG